MKKLTTKQLKKIDQTIKRLTKLFGEIDSFAAKDFPSKSLARKKNSTKIKGIMEGFLVPELDLLPIPEIAHPHWVS